MPWPLQLLEDAESVGYELNKTLAVLIMENWSRMGNEQVKMALRVAFNDFNSRNEHDGGNHTVRNYCVYAVTCGYMPRLPSPRCSRAHCHVLVGKRICNMGAAWVPHGCRMGAAWVPHGANSGMGSVVCGSLFYCFIVYYCVCFFWVGYTGRRARSTKTWRTRKCLVTPSTRTQASIRCRMLDLGVRYIIPLWQWLDLILAQFLIEFLTEVNPRIAVPYYMPPYHSIA